MLTRFATISGGGDRHGEPLNLSSIPTATANGHGHRVSAPRIENDSRDAIHCVYTVYNGTKKVIVACGGNACGWGEWRCHVAVMDFHGTLSTACSGALSVVPVNLFRGLQTSSLLGHSPFQSLYSSNRQDPAGLLPLL